MAVSVNPSATQVTTVGSTAGQIVDAEDIEAVNFWMKPVEIDEQEISKWLPPLKKKVNQQTHYIGQSYNPPISDTLGSTASTGSAVLTMTNNPINKGFKVNQKVYVREYYAGQTTYFDPTRVTKGRITNVSSTTITLDANASFNHGSGSVVTVYTSATPMATAFAEENVFRGDRIAQTVQRLQSGFIPVDERMRHTPTWASNDTFLDDIANLRKTMRDRLEGAYINGVYTPEVAGTPGEMRGMLDWADEISANVLALAGKQISVHHLRNRVTQKRKTHMKKAGDTVICDIDTMEALDLVLEPYKLYDEKSNSISIQIDSLKFRWGNLNFMPVMFPWPDGTILITSKEDWGAGNYDGMPWRPVQQDNANTGGTWETFGIYGDFTLDCYDVYRQILITGVNTFVSRYAGARTYGQAG